MSSNAFRFRIFVSVGPPRGVEESEAELVGMSRVEESEADDTTAKVEPNDSPSGSKEDVEDTPEAEEPGGEAGGDEEERDITDSNKGKECIESFFSKVAAWLRIFFKSWSCKLYKGSVEEDREDIAVGGKRRES